MEGEFGIDNLYFGVPCVVGAGGVEKILTFELTDAEKEAMAVSQASVTKTAQATGL